MKSGGPISSLKLSDNGINSTSAGFQFGSYLDQRPGLVEGRTGGKPVEAGINSGFHSSSLLKRAVLPSHPLGGLDGVEIGAHIVCLGPELDGPANEGPDLDGPATEDTNLEGSRLDGLGLDGFEGPAVDEGSDGLEGPAAEDPEPSGPPAFEDPEEEEPDGLTEDPEGLAVGVSGLMISPIFIDRGSAIKFSKRDLIANLNMLRLNKENIHRKGSSIDNASKLK